MKLAAFFLKIRLRAYFTTTNWKTILLNAGLLLLGLFYVFIISILLDRARRGNFFLTREKIISSVNIAVFALPFLLKVFPSFAYKKMLLSNHYPISKTSMAILDLVIFNFLRPVVLTLCFCLAVLYFSTDDFDNASTLHALLFVLAGFLFAENMVSSISWNRVGILLLGTVVVIPVVILNFSEAGILLSGLLVATIVLQLILQFHLYKRQADHDDESATPAFGTENEVTKNNLIFLKLSFRKPAFRITLFVAFAIKLMILFFYLPTSNNSLFTYTSNPVFFLAFVPTFLFTYIFNNLWGYFRALTFNIVLAGGGIRDLTRVYSKLLLVYVLADFLVAMTAIIVFDFFSFRLILAYLVSTFFSFSIGLTGSLYKFFEVKQAMSLSSFKPNTSPLINILTILPAMLFIFLYKEPIAFTIIVLFVFLTGSILFRILRRNEIRILVKLKSRIISG